MALALWRLLRGPSAQDRVLALDLIYVNGLLIVLVLGIRYASQMYFEAALLMALFGFLSVDRVGQIPASRRGDRMNTIPLWIEVVIAVLLVASGVPRGNRRAGARAAQGFFPAHAPAGARQYARRVVRLASAPSLLFGAGRRADAAGVGVNILLAITAPVTTVLLARAALFRKRQRGEDVPPPLANIGPMSQRGPTSAAGMHG